MPREFTAHVNEAGDPECLYAGCGKTIPADHYLCVRHYAQHQDGKIGPCPAEGCRRFRSLDYEQCADCGRAAAPECEPHWAAGDAAGGPFYAYLLWLSGGQLYAGHTRDLRPRLWEHRNGGCKATSATDGAAPADPPRLVYFQQFNTREGAADRELELKRLLLRNRRAALTLALEFQDSVRLVSPLLE